jgi:hypothetical protein
MMREAARCELGALTTLAYAQARLGSTPGSVELALRDVALVPYRFERSADYQPWHNVIARGYAACGDAAAYVAAAALRAGRRVRLALESGPADRCGAGYLHAVAYVDGARLDPYAAHACAVHYTVATGDL